MAEGSSVSITLNDDITETEERRKCDCSSCCSWYQFFLIVGTTLTALDMVTDLSFGGFNIFYPSTERIEQRVQGVISLLFIIWPVLVYSCSISYRSPGYYRTPVDAAVDLGHDNYNEFGRTFWGKYLLNTPLEPMVWGINHLLQTRNKSLNKLESGNEARIGFYASKKMMQVSIRNEAALESSYQTMSQLFICVLYYPYFSSLAFIGLLLSWTFSLLSVSRAAGLDVLKTITKSKVNNVEKVTTQSLGFKVCKFVFSLSLYLATLMANVLFVAGLYQLCSISFNLPGSISIIFSVLLCMLISTAFQFLWILFVYRNSIFEEISLTNNWWGKVIQFFHLIARAPVLQIFTGSTNLFFSVEIISFCLGLLTQTAQLLTLYGLSFFDGDAINGEVRNFCNWTFGLSILLQLIFVGISKSLVHKLNEYERTVAVQGTIIQRKAFLF